MPDVKSCYMETCATGYSSIKPFSRAPWRFHHQAPCAYADGFLRCLPMFGLAFQHAQMIMRLHKLRATENTFLDSLSLDYSVLI